MVVHFKHRVNSYGSLSAFLIGFVVRILGKRREPFIGIPAVIHYPFFDYEEGQQNFPVRTISIYENNTFLLTLFPEVKGINVNVIDIDLLR
ncbi:hypothetical protein Anas_02517 [Armadillidium nasatum]|uniref:Uncharacterized protein n=1 Tax=Armadillidium nasatum TaxID=96803 RepID=A0A5N5TBZ1_9CRUS|nr:hypothetical protein Anas_02517 [Armadillidium nasatum]